ncbi:MAG TPA: branched-chain amino acid ABC transporter permease [Thermoflexia bacterium]|jgi:branched-chain amino acid transport system permease protein|nr:branched-chain amino acid ABC transporter permease [Thermoflexia bacterium]
MQFLQQLVNGITIGAFYALVALGYTMVYGVLKLINFAHGDLFMWGAYLGLTGLTVALAALGYTTPWAILPVVIFVMTSVALMGVLVERIAYRPLRSAGRLAPVISALGVAFILESLARNVYGASWKTYPQGLTPSGGLVLAGGVRVSLMQIIVLVASFLLMAGLYLFVHRTRVGTAMRAVSLDHDVSRLMGVDVDRIIMIVFLIGPGLGGVAGLIVALYYGSFDFTLGWIFGLKAFIAAILGGIGNIPGAMLGGMLLGIIETLGAGYMSPQWKDVIAYIILILILIFRPTGLLGERVAEKL